MKTFKPFLFLILTFGKGTALSHLFLHALYGEDVKRGGCEYIVLRVTPQDSEWILFFLISANEFLHGLAISLLMASVSLVRNYLHNTIWPI